MRSARAGLQTLEKLQRSVEAGNYYEAQQMYKTLYARYMSAKKHTEAMDLLQSGASLQLRHGQVTCGVELGVLLIETFNKAHIRFTKPALDRVISIINDFPQVPLEELESLERSGIQKISEAYVEVKTRVEGFSTFMKAAIKWSIDSGGSARGAHELHDILADYLWTQSLEIDVTKASFHSVRGSCPEKFAAALVNYLKKCVLSITAICSDRERMETCKDCLTMEGRLEEADIVIARGALMYLSLGNLRDANVLMHEVEQGLGDQGFLNTPLMQFIKYLLLTLERDALPLFRMLREAYKSYIGRDSFFDEFLDAIAERFYGLPRKSGLPGMLGDVMKMFISD